MPLLAPLLRPLDVPIEIGREEAAQLARIELAKPVYAGEDEPWVQRAIRVAARARRRAARPRGQHVAARLVRAAGHRAAGRPRRRSPYAVAPGRSTAVRLPTCCCSAGRARPTSTAPRPSASPRPGPGPRPCARGCGRSCATSRTAAWSTRGRAAPPTRSRATRAPACRAPPPTCVSAPGSSTTSGTADAPPTPPPTRGSSRSTPRSRAARPAADAGPRLVPGGAAMSRIAPAPVADEVTTPRLRDRLRANRGLLLVGVLVLVGALLLALAQSSRQRGFLDPQAVDPTGSAALADDPRGAGRPRRPHRPTRRAARASSTSGRRRRHAARRPRPPWSPSAWRAPWARCRGPASCSSPRTQQLLDEFAPWASPRRLPHGRRPRSSPAAPGRSRRAPDRCAAQGATYAATRGDVTSCWQRRRARPGRGRAGRPVVHHRRRRRHGLHQRPARRVRQRRARRSTLLGRSDTLVWWLPSANDPLQFAEDAPVELDATSSRRGWAGRCCR